MMMCPGCGNPLYKGKDGAYLCEGGEYRYFLQLPTGREGNRTCLFLMLNPGTEKGHEQKSHRTRDKCHELAAKWGYGTLWTCNLFAAGGAKPAPGPQHCGFARKVPFLTKGLPNTRKVGSSYRLLC